MPILIRHNSTSESLSAVPFAKATPAAFLKEAELETLLIQVFQESGDQDEDTQIEFVDRQVRLEAGILDLLFVDNAGLLIAVEVKLERNDEARRQVVAQVRWCPVFS